MRGIPKEVLAEVRLAAECLQAQEAVAMKHGFHVSIDHNLLIEVRRPSPLDLKFQQEEATCADNFALRLDNGQLWFCHDALGCRLISNVSYYYPGDGEPYDDAPDVQWEWMDEEVPPFSLNHNAWLCPPILAYDAPVIRT